MNRHGRISIERIEQAISVIGPEFLNTPQFEGEPLSAELGARVVVKIETINPIRSFKGRGSELYMSKVPAGSQVVCASAGNTFQPEGNHLLNVCQRLLGSIRYASN